MCTGTPTQRARLLPTTLPSATRKLQCCSAKAGFTIKEAAETTVTGNQPVQQRDDNAHDWPTEDVTHGKMYKSENAHERRYPFDSQAMTVTVRPMEVRTFLVKLA